MLQNLTEQSATTLGKFIQHSMKVPSYLWNMMTFIPIRDGHHGVGGDLVNVGVRRQQLAGNLARGNDEVIVGVLKRINQNFLKIFYQIMLVLTNSC